MEHNNDQEKLAQIIEALTSTGVYELDPYNFEDEDAKYRYKILTLICGFKKDEKGFLQINNIKEMKPINCLIQLRLLTLLQNIAAYTLEELIIRFDSISSCFYQLKQEKKFLDYLKEKKSKEIPFFTMIGFFAFTNLGKDISKEIKNLKKKDFIKVIIEKYINEMRKSLFNILLYYYQVVLHSNDNEEEINYDFIPNPNDILYTELKNSFERYICFNELFDEGEIVNFVNCLHKTITGDIKSIYLKQGPEISVINNIIKYIFEKILENFSSKFYHKKSNLNDLYELIAFTINNLSEGTYEENYSKFIIKYSNRYKQGNKNVVMSFFSGLNPDNFKETFNNLNLDINDNKEYYTHIGDYINQLSPKKKKKKDKKVSNVLTNDLNNNLEEKAINKIEELNDISNTNSQKNKIISNESFVVINSEKNIAIKENCPIKPLEEINKEKNTQNNNKLEEMEKQMKEMNEKYNIIIQENKSIKKDYQNIKEENKNIKETFNKFKIKAANDNVKIQSELFVLKKEMKQISYRDISKLIINNYIEKYGNKLKKEKNLNNKKDKAKKISTYLAGKEFDFYKKIFEKYYDSNDKSHITNIFHLFGKKNIIGLEVNKSDIINKIFSDYCNVILEEKIDNNNNTVIEDLFGIKKIISDLYDMKNMD